MVENKYRHPHRIQLLNWRRRGKVFVRWLHWVPDFWKNESKDPSEWFWEEGTKKGENSFIRERHLWAWLNDINFAVLP